MSSPSHQAPGSPTLGKLVNFTSVSTDRPKPGMGQASGNAWGMSTNPASYTVPLNVGCRNNPNQTLGYSPPLSHPCSSPPPPTSPHSPSPVPSPSLTFILCPIQLNHKFVNFFLIHHT